ncbi:MAG: hypothetical protein V3S01_04130 [Dehalococcoidia bacterium]
MIGVPLPFPPPPPPPKPRHLELRDSAPNCRCVIVPIDPALLGWECFEGPEEDPDWCDGMGQQYHRDDLFVVLYHSGSVAGQWGVGLTSDSLCRPPKPWPPRFGLARSKEDAMRTAHRGEQRRERDVLTDIAMVSSGCAPECQHSGFIRDEDSRHLVCVACGTRAEDVGRSTRKPRPIGPVWR